MGLFNFLRKKEEDNTPTVHTIINDYWLVDTENENKILKFYKEELDENDDYRLPAKELKEDFEGEKVYKYEPYELPLRMEGREVYSKTDGDWIRIGRLKKTADISEGDLKLYLYPNEYKYVTEDGIDKEKDDPYFGIECRKTKVIEKTPSR